MEGYRLEAYMAVREMAGHYPDIIAAMRVSMKSELDWTRCLDFLLAAAKELKRCLERGDQFKIDDIVAQFGDVAAFFDEDITNKIYTEGRFIQFVIDFGIALGIIFNLKEKELDDLALVRPVLDELFQDRSTHPVLDSLREAFGRGELGRTDFDAFVAAAREEWRHCDEVLGNDERFDPMNVLKRNKRIEAIVERDLLEGRYTATRFEYLILEILLFIADAEERALRSKIKKEETVMEKKGHEEELRALSQTIMEAVTNDAKVMAMLQDLKERGIVDNSTLLGLALRIGEIVEISGMALRQEELGEQNVPQSAEPAKPEASAVVPPAHELIDGRELSAKEAAFQAWSAERFDERAWLKNVGLIF